MELKSHPVRRRRGGFLLILLGMMMTVAYVDLEAGPWWERAVQRDREERLALELVRLQRAIELYSRRQHRPPGDLEDLLEIRPRILSRIPLDPMTRRRDWILETTLPGETLVSSRSPETALDGSRHAAWRARREGSTWVVDRGAEDR